MKPVKKSATTNVRPLLDPEKHFEWNWFESSIPHTLAGRCGILCYDEETINMNVYLMQLCCRDFQRVPYKSMKNMLVQQYVLPTVLFGKPSSTFVSVSQANDQENRFLTSAGKLENNFCVNNFLTGRGDV